MRRFKLKPHELEALKWYACADVPVPSVETTISLMRQGYLDMRHDSDSVPKFLAYLNDDGRAQLIRESQR